MSTVWGERREITPSSSDRPKGSDKYREEVGRRGEGFV